MSLSETPCGDKTCYRGTMGDWNYQIFDCHRGHRLGRHLSSDRRKCPAGRPAKPYKWPARKRLRLMAGQVAGECVGADARGYCSGSLLTVFPSWVLNCSEVSLRCIQTHGRRFLLARPPFYGAFSGVICSIPCDLPYGLRHHVIFGPAQVGRVRQDPKSSSQLCCAMSKCR